MASLSTAGMLREGLDDWTDTQPLGEIYGTNMGWSASVFQPYGTSFPSYLDYDVTSSFQEHRAPVDRPVVVLPNKAPPVSGKTTIVQEWEGVVTGIGEDTFAAELADLTNLQFSKTEAADLPIEDLADDDRKLLKEGAIFRWIIGYRENPGNKERSSRIVFRRLPVWTEDDLTSSRNKAEELEGAIRWD